MAKTHARLSPSGASRWTVCTASPKAQDGRPNKSNPDSRMGTTCHQMCEEILLGQTKDAAEYLDRVMVFLPDSEVWDDGTHDLEVISDWQRVTPEMVSGVDTFVQHIRTVTGNLEGTMFVEQYVSIGQFTGEPGATGSADVVFLSGNTIRVFDAKFGRHKVYASEKQPDGSRRCNLQMACYALGAIEDHQMLHTEDITQVTMSIVQPLAGGHVSEYSCTVQELREVESFLRQKADETRNDPVFVPSWDTCHFCRAKGHCQPQRLHVYKTALDGMFEDEVVEDPLPQQWAKVKFIRDWCDTVEERVHSDLSAGREVGDLKLVAGRKGDRVWDDPKFVEAELKRMRLKREEIYEEKLKSPAQLEKGTALGKTQKVLIFNHVTQAPGKPTIVPGDDPRPDLSIDDFFL